MLGNDGDRAARSYRLTGPGAISRAIAVSEEFASENGCTDAVRVRLLVIVEELVANILEHGDVSDGAPIWLELSAEPHGLRLILRDSGQAFNPRDARPLSGLPPERGGGAGLALVRAWSTLLSYQREAELNRLELLIPTDDGHFKKD